MVRIYKRQRPTANGKCRTIFDVADYTGGTAAGCVASPSMPTPAKSSPFKSNTRDRFVRLPLWVMPRYLNLSLKICSAFVIAKNTAS
jgi:hypothetical protein